MGLKNTIKKGLFSGYNVKKWVGLDEVKRSGRTIKNLYSDLYGSEAKSAQSKAPQSFEQAVKQYGLTEQDIQKRMKTHLIVAICCFIAIFPVFIYALYLFFAKVMILPGFVALMVSFLLSAYAFREHFNYFQMKQRRLGCSVKEWFHFVVASMVKGKAS